MNITARATSKQVFAAIAASGVACPPALAEAYETTVRISEGARNLGAGPVSIADAVYDALQAGRDPSMDKRVQSALVDSQIANPGISDAIDHRAFTGFREVLLQHADELVIAWQPVFDNAAEAFTAVHGMVGALDVADTASWLARPGGAELWASVQGANAVVDNIRGGWSGIGELTLLATSDPWHQVLRTCEVSWDQWTSLELARRKLTGWEATVAGLALSLPTFPEYRSRVAAITAGAQGAEAAEQESRRAALTGRRMRPLPIAVA